MKRTCLILIFLFTSSLVFSQNTKTFSVNGFVQDKESGEKLIGCFIFDSAVKKSVMTNAFGYFNLTLNEGDKKIIAHLFGYSEESINLTVSKDTTIVIKLIAAQPFKMGEVTVVGSGSDAKLSQAQMGQMTMTNKDVKSLPVFLGEPDIMRSLQILPGIQAANERSTGISVRGGSIDQNLFLLDDAPVFQISHLMGFFSAFNNDAVKEIKIYKGDIPANYGGRLSSLVDIRLKDGNMQNYNVAGGVGIICSDLSVEGPLVNDRASFIVSAKYSYVSLLLKRITSEVDLAFYDLHVKFNAILDDENRIYISSYIGSDNATIGLNADYHNNTLSARWNHVYNPNLFSNVSFIYSNYKYTNGYSSEDNSSLDYSWNSGIKQFTLKAEYNYYPDNNNTIDFGASTAYKDFMPGKLEGNRSAIANITQSVPFTNRVVSEKGVLDHALYISNQQKISDDVSFKYGVRASLYQNIGGHWVYNLKNYQVTDSFYIAGNKTYANSISVEPRLGINYRVSENSSLKASYTYTTQQDQLLMKTNGGGPLDIWFPSDNNIKPQTASQYSAGYVQYFSDNLLEASVEGYYKEMNNIIDYKDGATFLDDSSPFTINKTSYNFEEQLRTGKGYTYGAE
ncbi:MAG: carboxypeptidase-like regulatory domain-containing protein, partial [Bacteroidota bacterium]|nr:carboxypeptidase-like regulatory domain-containing protein [Bacteroidota bacterium]